MRLYSVPYFNRPYLEQDDERSISERIIDGKVYTLYRSNHGMAHSFRQGFLTRDIIHLLCKESASSLADWTREQVSKDALFPTQAAIVASFQRSGRESEISESAAPKIYHRYEQKDCVNFIKANKGDYFTSSEAIKLSQALPWSSTNSWDIFTRNLGCIIHCAHSLDLRRIVGFDQERIKAQVATFLYGNTTLQSSTGKYIIDTLWHQSGRYLAACGDRDMVTDRRLLEDNFYLLHQDPTALYMTLRECML